MEKLVLHILYIYRVKLLTIMYLVNYIMEEKQKGKEEEMKLNYLNASPEKILFSVIQDYDFIEK